MLARLGFHRLGRAHWDDASCNPFVVPLRAAVAQAALVFLVGRWGEVAYLQDPRRVVPPDRNHSLRAFGNHAGVYWGDYLSWTAQDGGRTGDQERALAPDAFRQGQRERLRRVWTGARARIRARGRHAGGRVGGSAE